MRKRRDSTKVSQEEDNNTPPTARYQQGHSAPPDVSLETYKGQSAPQHKLETYKGHSAPPT